MMRQAMMRWAGAAMVAGTVVAATSTPAAAASVRVLLYDFGDGAATFDPTEHAAHTQATALSTRNGVLKWVDYDTLFPPVQDGLVFTYGWTEDPAEANALQFELSIDAGWELTLETWSLSMMLQDTKRLFEMSVEQAGPGAGAYQPFADWGWFMFGRPGSSAKDVTFTPEGAPTPIVLSGGNTYRFSLMGTGSGNPKANTLFDNFALYGEMREVVAVPEPGAGALALAATGLWLIGGRHLAGLTRIRECRG